MRVSEIACLKFLHTHASQTVVDAGTGSIGEMLNALQKKAFLTMGSFLYNRPFQKAEIQHLEIFLCRAIASSFVRLIGTVNRSFKEIDSRLDQSHLLVPPVTSALPPLSNTCLQAQRSLLIFKSKRASSNDHACLAFDFIIFPVSAKPQTLSIAYPSDNQRHGLPGAPTCSFQMQEYTYAGYCSINSVFTWQTSTGFMSESSQQAAVDAIHLDFMLHAEALESFPRIK